MAAYAALVSLMNNIDQVMNHPRFSCSLDKKQIQPLLEKAGFLLDIIERNNHGGAVSSEAEDLERQIAFAAQAADDAIECHIVDQIRGGAISLLDLQQTIEDMDAVVEKAMAVTEKGGLGEEQPKSHPRPLTNGKTGMVGFDEELIRLMDVLTGQQSKLQIVSVAGMGGAGKSTLVRNVYENSLIVHHFDVRAWATLSQQYSVTKILSDLLSCKEESTTVEELGERLYKSLSGRRYLIILDVIWSIEVWDKLKFFFPDNSNGSRIVFTTRLSNVATQCSSSCFRINLLDEDKSWILFCQTVFGGEDCPPQLEGVGKEIARLCKGLPLSIFVIGGLLRRSDMRVEYWNNVAENINSILSSDENDDCLKILSLSYRQLDVHLKPCFLYMGTFREDSEIRASQIIKLWVAEGFIRPNGSQMLEVIAEGYLHDLVDRNLILVGRRRSNGNIRSCRVHDLIRDLCLQVSEKDKFFSCAASPLKINRDRQCRLIFHDFIIGDGECQMFGALESGGQLVRSLRCGGLKLPVVFKLLRVLKIANDCSAEAILRNLSLRFLTFHFFGSDSTLVRLPSSISLVWNLQTLVILPREKMLVFAPLEIWSLPQLRHVKCNRIYLPDLPPPSDGEDDFVILENLQTVIEAVNWRLSEEVCKRMPNINKLYLTYDNNVEGYDDCLFDHLHNLGGLHKLGSLKLVSPSRNSSWNADRLQYAFPASLKKLSLTNCSLHWDELTIIGSLPQLAVLKVDNSVEGQDWSPVDGEFIRLECLSIVDCDLRCWNAESSHFPVLKKLHLEQLHGLEEIPLDVGEIPTLEIIRVHDCSESVVISAMAIKEEQENLGYDGLQIHFQKYNSDREVIDEVIDWHAAWFIERFRESLRLSRLERF